MDKLYSKRVIIYKAVLCALLAPLYALLSYSIPSDNFFLYLAVTTVPIGCIYTLPFWTTLNWIRKYRVEKIGKYMLLDFLLCLIPATFSFLLFEIITAILNGTTAADGFVTVIFFIVFIIISLVFWLLYFVFSRNK